MILNGLDQRTLDAVTRDAADAAAEFDAARTWLQQARGVAMEPIAAEVWAFDASLERILLVRHRWRGWVCPGGRVEGTETPREAAVRELREETGVVADLLGVPAAVFVRAYREDWTPTLGLAYATVADARGPLRSEGHQPAAWVPLHRDWEGAFPEDIQRIRAYAALLGAASAHRSD